ncbi:Holliday junction resolvase-like protein [Chloroflexota bacterium]
MIKTKYQFENWKKVEEQRLAEVPKTAIGQSRAVLGGKFIEQIAPYLPEFKYYPTETSFIRGPIDLIVFSWLSARDPHEVVFIEVKTGKSKIAMTGRERKSRKLVGAGRVRWELIYRPMCYG